MNIVIIGCGYVGRRAASYWKTNGHFVTVTTRSAERIDELKECSSNVYLLGDLKPLIEGKEVILLSIAPERGGDYRATYLQTAEALLPHLKPEQHVIYTGSTSVYGDAQGGWVDEETPIDPLTPHAEVLAATEEILLKHPKCCIFRMGEIIGPGREFLDRLKKMGRSKLPGTGENLTNWIHVTDIVQALELARKETLMGVYNLCNDEHLPRKEVYEEICKQAGLPSPTWNHQPSTFFRGNKKVSNRKIKSAGLTQFTTILPLTQDL